MKTKRLPLYIARDEMKAMIKTMGEKWGDPGGNDYEQGMNDMACILIGKLKTFDSVAPEAWLVTNTSDEMRQIVVDNTVWNLRVGFHYVIWAHEPPVGCDGVTVSGPIL